MKKLMIAAAVAAIGAGAFAACDDPGEDHPAGFDALVYNVKFSAKTTVAKKGTVKQECDDPADICYLVKGSRKLAGIVFTCEPDCDDAAVAANTVQYFWDATQKVQIDGAAIEFNTLERIGKDKKTVAAEGTFKGGAIDLRLAGFGSYSAKSGYAKSISGYFAGVLDTPVCNVKCDDPIPATSFKFCDATEQNNDTTPAYGTWSWKYNSSASKKQANNAHYYKKLLPSYYVED